MNKKLIAEEFLKRKRASILNSEKSLENTRKRAREAPGSNVSHSDTSKFQHSNLQLGQQMCIEEAKLAVQALEEVVNKFKEVIDASTVRIGSIVIVEDVENEERRYYFIVPLEGGDKIEIENYFIQSVSAAAPVAMQLLGKKKGGEIKINQDVYEIIEII